MALEAADPVSQNDTGDKAPILERLEGLSIIEVNIHANGTTDDDGYASNSDADSSASTSISSSVRDYEFENNRRYHSNRGVLYSFPNDDAEQERENMKHAMILSLCQGRLHYAPLKSPQNILDIGTGTGSWCIDMGDEYPEAIVTGIDISPIQPQWVPPNVRFLVEDIEQEWLFPDNSLDYIHVRHMTAAIRDFPTLLSRAFKALRPGGWLEMQEVKFELRSDDGSLREDNQLAEFLRVVSRGLATFNIDLLSMRHNLDRLRDASFVNLSERVLKAPIGRWPHDPTLRTIGIYHSSIFADGLQAVAMRPCTQGLGWTAADVEIFLVDVRKSLNDATQHLYVPVHIVLGQKPDFPS